MYNSYMSISISAAHARARWSETIDLARVEPVTITRNGRDSIVLMDAGYAARAIEALENAEDLEAVRAAKDEGGAIPWDEVKADLNLG